MVWETERAFAGEKMRRRSVLFHRLEMLGRFDKSLEYFDKAIRASPDDTGLAHFYGGKAAANFGLRRYDQAIELARQAIAINPNYVQYIQSILVAALALTGHDAEAREAL
jgi:tetratricopeptide (TPR) repeat protein